MNDLAKYRVKHVDDQLIRDLVDAHAIWPWHQQLQQSFGLTN